MCSTLTAKAYSINRKKNVEGISDRISYTLLLNTLLLVADFFIMYYGVYHDSFDLLITSFLILTVSIGISSFIALMNFFSEPHKQYSYQELVKKNLEGYFEKL